MGKIIFGIIFSFIGVLFLITNIFERNSVAQLGGFFLSLLFLILGIVLFVKGLRATGKKSEVEETKKKARWSLPAKIAAIFMLFIIVVYYAGRNRDLKPTSAPSRETLSQPAKEPERWLYRESPDKMRGTNTRYASVQSINKLYFDLPYSGGSSATLMLRKSPEFGRDVILSIEKGQFLCNSYDGCTVAMRFDSGKVEKYSAVEPSDGSSDVLFLRPYEKIVSKLRNSKHLTIEAEFYREGRQQIEFDVAGLNWK
jgi:hypothetical protein